MTRKLCFPEIVIAKGLTYDRACALLTEANHMPKLSGMYSFFLKQTSKKSDKWSLIGRHIEGVRRILKDPDAYVLEW